MSHLLLVFCSDDDLAIDLIHEVKEAICAVTVMPAVREKTKLSVEKDDCVVFLEKVFCRSSASSASREVVNEPDSLILQRHSSSSGCDQNNTPVRRGIKVEVDELPY